MAAATERLVVLVTPEQKSIVMRRAKVAGLSVGDYICRQVLDEDDALTTLMQALTESAERARIQLDATLSRIDQSDRTRDALMAKARQEAQAAFRADLDPERFSRLLADIS